MPWVSSLTATGQNAQFCTFLPSFDAPLPYPQGQGKKRGANFPIKRECR